MTKYSAILSILDGVFLSYSKPRVLQEAEEIVDGHPQIHFDLVYKAYVFRPRFNVVFSGVVNNIGEDRISCLLYDYFNVSVVMGEGQRESQSRTFLSNCEVGAEIQFRIIQIDAIGGIVLLKGELYW